MEVEHAGACPRTRPASSFWWGPGSQPWDPRVGLKYDELKKVVLAAYKGVLVAYRQKLRRLKREARESYLDAGIAFDR